MRCYRHPYVNAIGICTVCERGICKADCVTMDGKLYCKVDAEKRLEDAKHAANRRRRGFAVSAAAVLSEFNGLAAVIVGFLLVVIGFLGPAAHTSPIVSHTVRPFLSYFGNVLAFPQLETLFVGFVALLGGIVDMASGYYLWQRSMGWAVISVVAAIFAELLTTSYFEVFAIAGSLTLLWLGSTVLKIVFVGAGWRHLK